jgi:hypothetical protein
MPHEASVVVLLLCFGIAGNSATLMSAALEERTSRVVEVLSGVPWQQSLRRREQAVSAHAARPRERDMVANARDVELDQREEVAAERAVALASREALAHERDAGLDRRDED